MPPHCQFSFSIPATACINAMCISLYCQHIAIFLSLLVSQIYVMPLHCLFNAPLTVPATVCIMAVAMLLYCQFNAPILLLPVSWLCLCTFTVNCSIPVTAYIMAMVTVNSVFPLPVSQLWLCPFTAILVLHSLCPVECSIPACSAPSLLHSYLPVPNHNQHH
jgi:hypothetical protein